MRAGIGHAHARSVEVNPFGWPQSAKQLEALGGVPRLRKKQGTVFETDGGHYILDWLVDTIPDPVQLEARLNRIPGVVENGLFVDRTSTLIIGSPDGVQIKHRPS